MTSLQHREDRPRIVSCNVEPAAYELVASWAKRRGFEIVLVITTPGPSPRTFTGHQDIVARAPHTQDILVTNRLQRAASLIAAAQPDIILSYTFPLRIPAEVIKIPRIGAVNLHPSPLPAYRGPNPARMLYDGAPTLGATLHRLSAGFDAGPILGQQEKPVPNDPTIEAVRDTWEDLLVAALDEGVDRLLAGEPAIVQNESHATYAAAFSQEERWISWNWSPQTIQRRVTALNLLVPTARGLLDTSEVQIREAFPVEISYAAAPGDVVARGDGDAVVAAAGGAVHLFYSPLTEGSTLDEAGGQILERDLVRIE